MPIISGGGDSGLFRIRVGAIAEAEAHAEFDKLLYRESRDGEIIPEF